MGRIVTLLTDFGTRDPYVAAMKGVVLSIVPDARLVDITHDIAPQDVPGAAYVLGAAWSYFPQGSIHLVVVDPGVGSARRAVAVRAGGHLFVAPDNGVLTHVLREEAPEQAVELRERRYWRAEVSHTFHGRDIFAPVAAHLARGVSLEHLGPSVDNLVRLPWDPPRRLEDGTIVGHVIHVDRFGNLVSDIPPGMVVHPSWVEVRVGKVRVRGLSNTYADVDIGQVLALVGSHERLEVAVRQGSAARRSGAGVGATVYVREPEDGGD